MQSKNYNKIIRFHIVIKRPEEETPVVLPFAEVPMARFSSVESPHSVEMTKSVGTIRMRIIASRVYTLKLRIFMTGLRNTLGSKIQAHSTNLTYMVNQLQRGLRSIKFTSLQMMESLVVGHSLTQSLWSRLHNV